MGEGCIRLSKTNVTDSRTKSILKDRISMAVIVGMADEKVIDWLYYNWGGYRAKTRKDSMNIWTISSGPALGFLRDIQPFLFGEKLEQLELAIRFQEQKIPNVRSKEQYEWELWAYSEMRALKPRNKKEFGRE